MNLHKFVTHIKTLLCGNNSCSYLRSLQDDIEHSTETSLNTSHLGILLTPWSGNIISSYCTPHSAHTYLHSAGIINTAEWSGLIYLYISFLRTRSTTLACIGREEDNCRWICISRKFGGELKLIWWFGGLSRNHQIKKIRQYFILAYIRMLPTRQI